jgi:hypothetical protein
MTFFNLGKAISGTPIKTETNQIPKPSIKAECG